MGNEDLRTLLSIYLNPEFDTEEDIKENLKVAGIDAEQFTREVLARIELVKKEAEAKAEAEEI
jgi:hypothetical protein